MPITTHEELALLKRAESAEARVAELEAAVEEALRELGSATLANSPAVRATTALLRAAQKFQDEGAGKGTAALGERP